MSLLSWINISGMGFYCSMFLINCYVAQVMQNNYNPSSCLYILVHLHYIGMDRYHVLTDTPKNDAALPIFALTDIVNSAKYGQNNELISVKFVLIVRLDMLWLRL